MTADDRHLQMTMTPHHEHDSLTHALMAEKLNRCRPPQAPVHAALVDAPWRRAQRTAVRLGHRAAA